MQYLSKRYRSPIGTHLALSLPCRTKRGECRVKGLGRWPRVTASSCANYCTRRGKEALNPKPCNWHRNPEKLVATGIELPYNPARTFRCLGCGLIGCRETPKVCGRPQCRVSYRKWLWLFSLRGSVQEPVIRCRKTF